MLDIIARGIIVKHFNSLTGLRTKSKCAQMDALFDEINAKLPNVSVATLKTYIKESNVDYNTNFYEIMRPEAIAEALDIELQDAVYEPVTEPVQSVQSESNANLNNTLGLLEKALLNVVTEEAKPLILDNVKVLAEQYIKENYGAVTRTVRLELPEKGAIEETTHPEFETVLSYVMAEEPVMLVGPAGTGKNVICEQIAKVLNLPFYFSNAVTQEYKLTGFTDANGTFHESQFFKAFKNGGVFMLDEMDASIPETLIILNAALANRYFDFPAPIGKVEAHPDFRVIAGANTFGTGADDMYSGRFQLDGASLDRFATVEINYSSEIEETITEDKELLTFFREYRKATEKAGVQTVVSYRALKRLEKMKLMLSKDKLIKTALTKNLEKDDIRMIKSTMNLNSWDNEWMKAFESLI